MNNDDAERRDRRKSVALDKLRKSIAGVQDIKDMKDMANARYVY
jgi:hypothetical protein